MSSRRGEGQSFPASIGGNDGPSSKGKLVQGSGSGQGNSKVDQSHDMADVSLQQEQWGSSTPPNDSGNGGAVRTSGHNPTPANDPRRPAARVNQIPLQSDMNWIIQNALGLVKKSYSENESEGSDDDMVDNSDDGDDDDLSNDYDSDVSQKSHDTRKKNKWFEGFFNSLAKLVVEEVNEQTRQWHCPACQNGPGAIDWYKGLQPLMAHAKTKVSRRVKLHREFAELLDEELRLRGIMVIPAGEVSGEWEGLQRTILDYQIVWPPTVVVVNTRLKYDDNNNKWIGMGNQELLEYFSTYAVKRARQSYGPRGHSGMSVLIFEANAMGYLEAERLHMHFEAEGRGRDAWKGHRMFFSSTERVLHGYLAWNDDMDSFNRHFQGKSRLKFEMRSHQEEVVGPLKKMSEDNRKLIRLKNKAAKYEQRAKVVEKSLEVLSQELWQKTVENRMVRYKTEIQHKKHNEELDCLERFFKEQMDKVLRATEEKEKNYEKQLEEERAKAERTREITTFIVTLLGGGEEFLTERDKLCEAENETKVELKRRHKADEVKLVEEFETERAKMIEAHNEKKVDLDRRHLLEEIELGELFHATLTELMKKFAPCTSEASTSSS